MINHAIIAKNVRTQLRNSLPETHSFGEKSFPIITSREVFDEEELNPRTFLRFFSWSSFNQGITFLTSFDFNLKYKYQFRPNTKETTFKSTTSESGIVTNVNYHTVVEEFRYLNETDYQGVVLPLSVSMKGLTAYFILPKQLSKFDEGFPILFFKKMLQADTTAFIKVTIPFFFFQYELKQTANLNLHFSPNAKFNQVYSLSEGSGSENSNMASYYRICPDMKGGQLTKDLFEPNFLKEMTFSQAFYVALVDDSTKGVVIQFYVNNFQVDFGGKESCGE